jgi:hypothetical protein
MEFLIFFGILTILFVVWLVVYVELNQEAFMDRDKKSIMDTGKSIQTQIFVASTAHSGYRSNNLYIPDKINGKPVSINISNYVFYISTSNQDYSFHIPYTVFSPMGAVSINLEPGYHPLWSRNGLVAISAREGIDYNFEPLFNYTSGKYYYSACQDGIDNDEDVEPTSKEIFLDEKDGGCWSNYTNPHYDPYKWSEEGALNCPGTTCQEKVYDKYWICRAAQQKGVCDALKNSFSTITAKDCCLNTYENFCSPHFNDYQYWGGCNGTCSC